MLSIWELQSRRAFVYQLDRKASIANSYSELRHQPVIGSRLAFCILVWFGLYIYPTKPKPVYRAGQKKKHSPLLFSFPQRWFEHRI